jgi:hypothetical protein
VIATDPSDNASQPTKVTVGAITGVLSPAKLYREDTMILRGFNFGPGEQVTVVCNSTAYNLGTFTAGQNGQVIAGTWKIPADIEVGQHICTFTGAQSGPVSVPFQVLEPVIIKTGGSVTTGPTSSTGLVAGPGFGTAVLAKRKLG